jgi:hypothetical protein
MMKNLKKVGDKIVGDWYEVIVIGLLSVILYFVIKCKKVENLTNEVKAEVASATAAVEAEAVQQVRQRDEDAVKSKAVEEQTIAQVAAVSGGAGKITAFSEPGSGVGLGVSNVRPSLKQDSVEGPNETASRTAALNAKYANVPRPEYKQQKRHNYAVGYPCDRK